MTDDNNTLEKSAISSIDKNRLDEEWEGHSDRTFDYSQLLAEAEHDVLELEGEMKVVEAEAELDIRNRPKRYKIKPPVREAAVKLHVVLHPKVKRARRRLNHAKHRQSMLKGACKSLDHRKTALENLVVLDGRAYFARPVDRERASEFKKGQSKKRRVVE